MALVLRNNLLYAHSNITSERCCSLELDLLQLQHGIKHSDAKKQIHAFNALITFALLQKLEFSSGWKGCEMDSEIKGRTNIKFT